MHPLGPVNLDHVPAHRLFPEAYEASKKQIVKDFLFFGGYIVTGVVLVARLGALLS